MALKFFMVATHMSKLTKCIRERQVSHCLGLGSTKLISFIFLVLFTCSDQKMILSAASFNFRTVYLAFS